MSKPYCTYSCDTFYLNEYNTIFFAPVSILYSVVILSIHLKPCHGCFCIWAPCVLRSDIFLKSQSYHHNFFFYIFLNHLHDGLYLTDMCDIRADSALAMAPSNSFLLFLLSDNAISLLIFCFANYSYSNTLHLYFLIPPIPINSAYNNPPPVLQKFSVPTENPPA